MGLNFSNLKDQMREMCDMRPILIIPTSWHIEFEKLRPFLKKAGVQYCVIDTP